MESTTTLEKTTEMGTNKAAVGHLDREGTATECPGARARGIGAALDDTNFVGSGFTGLQSGNEFFYEGFIMEDGSLGYATKFFGRSLLGFASFGASLVFAVHGFYRGTGNFD
jgi:hypothetical protein